MGYYGITFGMVDLSDDLFTNYIASSVIGGSFFNIYFLAFQYSSSSTGPVPLLDSHYKPERLVTEFC